MVRSFSEETIRLANTNSFQQVRNSNVAAVTIPVGAAEGQENVEKPAEKSAPVDIGSFLHFHRD